MTVPDLARRLDVTTITIYRWRSQHGLPSVSAETVAAVRTEPAQRLLFSYESVTDWLRDKRPELLPIWNGDTSAPVKRVNAWTRRRLREAISLAAA